MNKINFLPCPFCGDKAILRAGSGLDKPFQILCGCGGRVGWFKTEEEVIEAWNRRRDAKWNISKTEFGWNGEEYPSEYTCSSCGFSVKTPHNYCPNCGTRMSSEINAEERGE